MNGEPRPARVGLVGLGPVSRRYLDTIRRLRVLDLVALADRDCALSAAVAHDEGVRAVPVDELLAGGLVDLVVNLATPAVRAELSARALDSGASVFSASSLATTRDDAVDLLVAAERSGARLGCAPDTVLGTGVQTARAAIDGGRIGRPVSATASVLPPRHGHRHPGLDVLPRSDAGPLPDRVPCEIVALLHLLGPVADVIGMGSRPRGERILPSDPYVGRSLATGVDTRVIGSLRHRSGAVSTLVTSPGADATRAGHIEVHGEHASLALSDPGRFEGHVFRRVLGERDWELLPVAAGYRGATRGYGAADLVAGLSGRERASAGVALHALDVMLSLFESARERRVVPTSTGFAVPAPVPLSDAPGGLVGAILR